MKSTAAILISTLIAGCTTPPAPPPMPVEVKVAVPIPCEVPEPQCPVPAYDGAAKSQPMDDRIKLLRVEAIEQGECLRQYQEALKACRTKQ